MLRTQLESSRVCKLGEENRNKPIFGDLAEMEADLQLRMCGNRMISNNGEGVMARNNMLRISGTQDCQNKFKSDEEVMSRILVRANQQEVYGCHEDGYGCHENRLPQEECNECDLLHQTDFDDRNEKCSE